MPYKANPDYTLKYRGNHIYLSWDVLFSELDVWLLSNRISRIKNEKMFYHLSKIDNAIFMSTVQYFHSLNAQWLNLPLTTLMISSPGEVYAWQTLDYTTDTLPVELPNWFDGSKRIFLSESSQFYLELWLLIKNIDQVFSIYNSFRKEKSDATHLSEFQHIEYEWKVDLEWNIKVFMWLFEHIFNHIIKNNKEDLLFFISEEELNKKIQFVKNEPKRITFREALDLLYKDTNNEKYKEFSLKNFGSWEEVRLTEILEANVIVTEFPMLQIPFYHAIAEKEVNWVPVAKNADFILYGFRETIWAWERIKDKNVLLKKAEIFNLPENDYLPYLQTRDFEDYVTTSGFGLGWQRLVQWLTNQPYIYEATIFPRTHLIPNP